MTRSRVRLAALAVAGCLLPLAAGQAVASRKPLDGPLNVLLVGIDPRGTHVAPLADTIVVAHLPADRHNAYLFSLPRDLVVRIPAFPASGSPARRAKINAAMALGSRTSDGEHDPAQGYGLLARTAGQVTGIREFDAGAILNFGGFTAMVQAMGGVKMVIDQDVVSEHRKPDGRPRDRLPECQAPRRCLRPYTGPQKHYRKSDRPVPLKAWEALDYLRQRYGLPRVDYDRQRHQRQFLKAMAARAVKKEVVADPVRLAKVVNAIGTSLTFTGSDHSILDWARELRTLNAATMVSVGLPGTALFGNGKYVGEQLPASASAFFEAVAEDRVAAFLVDHPGVVTVEP